MGRPILLIECVISTDTALSFATSDEWNTPLDSGHLNLNFQQTTSRLFLYVHAFKIKIPLHVSMNYEVKNILFVFAARFDICLDPKRHLFILLTRGIIPFTIPFFFRAKVFGTGSHTEYLFISREQRLQNYSHFVTRLLTRLFNGGL